MIGRGSVLYMFCTLQCLGWCPIRSPPSMIVMFGGEVVFLGPCLQGNLYRSKESICRGWGGVVKTNAFGNPRLQGLLTEVLCDALEEKTHVRASCALAWFGSVPPRVEAFCWLEMGVRVSISNMLRR
eukprot:TRINITY_DN29312_c0_g3_i1.p1 TRINITY_DN29312_c0_g3~~TRINITY_DN29312_c0_g3_i1.p1  ORF type:complete len:127 (+),score=16.77 TRINITY_DN29312_c0_g3_i1:1227-1607(+)